jgi:hypothetical protein
VADIAGVVVALSTIFGVLAAAWAAYRGKDPTSAGAIGGAIGIAAGVVVAVLDALFFRG